MYAATKFFVEALTQSLRLETVGSGVKVTSIQPGMIITVKSFDSLSGSLLLEKFST